MTPHQKEYKAFAVKLDGPPDEQGRFTGYAATFGNVDKGGDLIEPGAFTKTLQEMKVVPILAYHDTTRPVGVSVTMVQDAKGLRVEGQLALEVQDARELYALMQIGAVKAMSIGYYAIQKKWQGPVRHLQELKLVEFSLVVFPMNDNAIVTDVKQVGTKDATWALRGLLGMIETGSSLLAAQPSDPDLIMEGILTALAAMVADEVAGISEPDEADESYSEVMTMSVTSAIKHLESLLTREPAEATHAKEAAPTVDEPATVATQLAQITALLRG